MTDTCGCEVRLQDGKLSVLDAHEVDGPLVQPDTLAHGLVHEVLVDGQQRRGRGPPGRQRLAIVRGARARTGRTPHTHDLGTVDLTVRVPTDALRGVDPSNVTLSVHDVQEHPQASLEPHAALAQQPTLKLAPQASVAFDQVELPDSLRSLMATK